MRKVKSILIVEGDLNLRNLISQRLTHYSYNVRAVSTGAEGWVAASTFTFDYIILDINLPDMHGTQFIIELTRRYITTPILLVTNPGEVSVYHPQIKNTLLKPVPLLNEDSIVDQLIYKLNKSRGVGILYRAVLQD